MKICDIVRVKFSNSYFIKVFRKVHVSRDIIFCLSQPEAAWRRRRVVVVMVEDISKYYPAAPNQERRPQPPGARLMIHLEVYLLIGGKNSNKPYLNLFFREHQFLLQVKYRVIILKVFVLPWDIQSQIYNFTLFGSASFVC